ncbi:MAG: PEGA domain-containing protein [Myxococcales bacterium]|nr:PEGA domain-containing protein [Myxococcales bacterium]
MTAAGEKCDGRRRRSWWWAWSLVAIGWLLLARAPLALGQPAPDAAAQARTHLAAARQAVAGRDYAAAAEHFAAAQARAPSAEALAGLGDAHYRLGHVVRAHEAYADLLRDHADVLAPAARRLATERKAELDGKTGQLSIRVNESGAAVTVDGELVGRSPVPALLRVLAGEHRVRVEKEGFAPDERRVTVPADGKLVLPVALEMTERRAPLEVRARGDAPIRVFVDGEDVGAAPYAGEVAWGTHEIAGRGEGLVIAPRTLDVGDASPRTVVLEVRRAVARLEIRTTDGEGTIAIDGREVGSGSFEGELPAGKHELAVRREGFEPHTLELELEPGQSLAATVSLRPAAGADLPGGGTSTRLLEGVYGGIDVAVLFVPGGSHPSQQTSCAMLGATSCESPTPVGPGLAGFLGYALDPLGFELWAAALGDFAHPSASFDGRTSGLVNPLVSLPAREEELLIARAGFAGAVRLRVGLDLEVVRLGFVAGVGLAHRTLWLRRDTEALDGSGASDVYAPEAVSYLSPGLSLEAGLGVPLDGATQFTLGLVFWSESASSQARTPPAADEWLSAAGDTVPPRPHYTPAYDLASGPQVFLGPRLGLELGP